MVVPFRICACRESPAADIIANSGAAAKCVYLRTYTVPRVQVQHPGALGANDIR